MSMTILNVLNNCEPHHAPPWSKWYYKQLTLTLIPIMCLKHSSVGSKLLYLVRGICHMYLIFDSPAPDEL